MAHFIHFAVVFLVVWTERSELEARCSSELPAPPLTWRRHEKRRSAPVLPAQLCHSRPSPLVINIHGSRRAAKVTTEKICRCERHKRTPSPPSISLNLETGNFPDFPARHRKFGGQRPPWFVRLTACGTLRVLVPPSAKLTTPPLHLRVVSFLKRARAAAGGAFTTAAPQSPMQLPCYCPLIHCSGVAGGWRGGGGGGSVMS